jgi:hypothetical protein
VTLSADRAALATVLAGDPPDLTVAPSFDGVKALPAVIVEPDPAIWLDGSTDSGPGRIVRYAVTVRVIVNAQEPIGALVDLEEIVERVLGRVPPAWRIDRATGPQRIAARGGELTASTSAISLSTRYSISFP